MAGNLDFETTLSANTNTFISAFRDATNTIANLGNSADASAQNLEQMSQYGRQHIQSLNLSLAQARAELVHLSATNATPQDIANAQNRIQLLQTAISQTTTVFDAYGAHAQNAMRDAANGADGAGAQLTQLQQEVSTLVGGLDGVRSSLDENGNSATHTRQQLEQMAENATTQLNQYKRQLEQAKLEVNRLAATNASPADIEQARQRVRELETGVEQVETSLDGYRSAARIANNEAASGANRSATAFEQVNTGVNGAKFAVNALVGAMAALGVGLGINELAQAADTYTNLSARINIATKDGGDFTSAMAGVHQVALMTNSSLEATGNLFTKINDTGKEMGMTQQQALDLTKTINQAIQIGGGSAQAGEAALQQFIQALQSGVLRGDEFNSIMEQAPGLTSAMAKGLGVTTGELRKMAENGELGAERITKALQSQAGQIQATYDKFPTTIGNALQRIATSWQILIGEMDQANGASATAAQWLSTLADNMMLLKPIIDDIGSGFSRFGEYYSNIYDQATIDSLKTTLTSVYETIKTLFNTVLEVGEAFHSVFSDALSNVLSFTDGLYPAGEQVSGYKKFIDLLNIALGFLSDGFKTIGIGVNLFTGTLYGLLAVWYELKSKLSWGDTKKQAIADMEEMRAKSQEYFDKGFKGATEFKSKMLENIDELGKTEQQKNQERIVENQKTLEQLKAQEEKHKADYKAISDERIQLNQQLQDARKSGDQSAIDAAINGLAQLDAKEKAYQAESKKITDAKIQAAQVVANAMIKSADAAGLAQLKVLNAQLAAQGLQAEFDSTGKIIVKAMDDGAKATENQGNATDKARKAAVALGLDLDVSLNRVSAKFKEGETNVNNFVAGLEGLGVKGKQAGEVTYEAWIKWLETAKSQAEIDVAKAKLQEFGNQGQVSTSQVEQGLIAIKLQAKELPDDIDPITASFKALGIETKENLKLAAQKALMDFINIRDSGKATAEGVQKAYEKMAQTVAASGDTGVIAAANAANAGRNLEIQIDDTGKASVKAMDEWTKSNDRVRNSAESIGDGYRNAGSIAREEAKSAEQAWADAVDAASAQFDAEMKRQGQSLSKGIYNYNSYSKADVVSQLKSKGYDDKEAEKLAGTIWSKAMEADRDAKAEGMGKGGNPALNRLIEQEFNNASAKGLTTQHGTNKINDLLRQMSSNNLVSTGSTSKAPAVDVNSLAPQVSTPIPSVPSTDVSKTVKYEFNSGGKAVTLYGSPNDGDAMEEMLRELEMLKKGM